MSHRPLHSSDLFQSGHPWRTIRRILVGFACFLVVTINPVSAQKPAPQKPPVAPRPKNAAEPTTDKRSTPAPKTTEAQTELETIEAQFSKKSCTELLAEVGNANPLMRLTAIRFLKDCLGPAETREEVEKVLLEQLKSDAWMIRGEAAFSLGFGTVSPVVSTALVQALKDDHWFVRARAVQAVGQLKIQAAVPDLVQLFGKESWDTRARVVYALGQIGDSRRIDVLLTAMNSEDESLRLVALQALKNLRGERAKSALLQAIATEKTAEGKLQLVRAVGNLRLVEAKDQVTSWRGESLEFDRELTLTRYKLGETGETEALIRDFGLYPMAVQQELIADWTTKREALAGPLMLTLLADTASPHRQAAASALEALGEKVPVSGLLQALVDVDPPTREILVRMLRATHDSSLPELIIARLKDEPPPPEREALLTVLDDFKTSQTIDALLAARLDDKQKPRQAINLALERFNVTLEVLAGRAANAELSPEQRIEATAWLGQLGEATAVTKLTELLKSSDTRQRLAAVEALGKVEDRTAIDALIVSLEDPAPEIRTAARTGLSRFGVTPERMVADLKSENWQIRYEALRLLSQLGGAEHSPAIVPLLNDPESLIRRTAATVVGEFKETRAIEPLLALLRDSDLTVRAAAASALGVIGDHRAATGLLAALKTTTDATVSLEIASALAKLKNTQAVPVLLEMMRTPNWTARAQVARILGPFRDQRAVAPLVAALDDPSAVVRYYARQSLVQIGVTSPGELVGLFGKADGRARFGVMEVVRTTNLTTSTEQLLNYLEDTRLPVRAMAAYLIGELRDPKATDRLLMRLELEDRFAVRWWLTFALGNIGEPAREPLLKLVRHKLTRVRADAVRALGFMPPTDASRQVLLAGLEDKEDQVRTAAIEALGRSGDPSVISSLTTLLLTPVKLNKDGIPENLVRPETLVNALVTVGAPGKKALVDALAQTDARLRILIIHKLGEDADPTILPMLMTSLRDSTPQVRIAALQELARQSSDKVIELMLGILNDGNTDVRLEAVKLLIAFNDPQALEGLKTHLQREPSAEIRALIEQRLQGDKMSG